MSDNVHELEVLLYDGRRLRVGKGTSGDAEIDAAADELRDRYADLVRERYPDIPRRVSGYNLDDLLPENGFNVAAALVGTEGTCVTVLEATVHLIPRRSTSRCSSSARDSEYEAADHVMTRARARADRARGRRPRADRGHEGRRHAHEDVELVPKAGLARRRVRRRHERGGRRRRTTDRAS
jgi:hypothetical protein